MYGFPLVKSIFILRQAPFSGYSPFLILSNSTSVSSLGRSRCSHATGFPLPPPRSSLIFSARQGQLPCHRNKQQSHTITGTDIGFASLDQLDGELVETVKVVGRIGNLPRLEAEPSDRFKNGLKVATFFLFGIGVVVSGRVSDAQPGNLLGEVNSPQICSAVVILGIPEVHHDCLDVT
jgi:hypothetical protein